MHYLTLKISATSLTSPSRAFVMGYDLVRIGWTAKSTSPGRASGATLPLNSVENFRHWSIETVL